MLFLEMLLLDFRNDAFKMGVVRYGRKKEIV